MGTVKSAKQMRQLVKQGLKPKPEKIYPFIYTGDKDGYRYGEVNGWYTSEHRWVYAKSLGLNVWDLDGDIVVHHKDHNRQNNRIENLEGFTPEDAKAHDWGVYRHPRGSRAIDLHHCKHHDCFPNGYSVIVPKLSMTVTEYLGRELRDGEHMEIVKGKIELWQDNRNSKHCLGCLGHEDD